MRHVQIEDAVGERLQEIEARAGIPQWIRFLPAGIFLVGFAAFAGAIVFWMLRGQRQLLFSEAFSLTVAAAAGIAFVGILSAIVLNAITNLRLGTQGVAEAARLRAGRQGEKSVVTALAGLDQRWAMFSGVVVKGVSGDIDHVLIGPAGVFALEVKYWSGDIVYDGARHSWYHINRRNPDGEPVRDPTEQACQVSNALQRALKYSVFPVVVLSHPKSRLLGKYEGVPVLLLPELRNWLRDKPVVLDEHQIKVLEDQLQAAIAAARAEKP